MDLDVGVLQADVHPNCGPKGRCIDFGGYGPIRPGGSLPFNAVYGRRQLAKGGLVGLPFIVSPRQVVELRDAMRNRDEWLSILKAVLGVGGTQRSSGRKLRDCNVVGDGRSPRRDRR